METRTLASEWNQLAIYLGLPSDLINSTIKMAGGSFPCWSEALRQWIKQNYNTKMFGEPSWRSLLRAVAKVNKLQFKTLTSKHKGVNLFFPSLPTMVVPLDKFTYSFNHSHSFTAEPCVPTTSEDLRATVSKHVVVDIAPVSVKGIEIGIRFGHR